MNIFNPTRGTFEDADKLNASWDALRKAPGNGYPPELLKAINQATGLVWYDLEPYAKLLFPVITPLRNRIPRVGAEGGTATHWISVTGININKVSIALGEGQRGGSVTTQVVNNTAQYKSWGLDDSVTWQADFAAKNLDDAKQLAVDNLLRAVMIGEEAMIIGGNADVQLGTTPTPTVAGAGTGGTLQSQTLSVVCVALAFDAYNSVGGNNAAPGNNIIVPAVVTRSNTDGSSLIFGGGSAQKSANATVVLTSSGGNPPYTASASASVVAVKGAVGYAWFWGPAGSELLGAVTSINSVAITALATAGNQQASSMPASDNSTNIYLCDGLISQVTTPGSNSYYAAMPTGVAGTGTPLTSDSAGGVVEINTALKSFWDNFRLAPDMMLVNSQELQNITNKVIAGGGAPLFRFVSDSKDGDGGLSNHQVVAGAVVGSYLNRFTMSGGQLMQVLLHPNVPPGTIIFYSSKLPYPLSNVRNLLQFKMRRDYYQIEWPVVKPSYDFSVFADGVLQNYFPPGFGIITNIANG